MMFTITNVVIRAATFVPMCLLPKFNEGKVVYVYVSFRTDLYLNQSTSNLQIFSYSYYYLQIAAAVNVLLSCRGRLSKFNQCIFNIVLLGLNVHSTVYVIISNNKTIVVDCIQLLLVLLNNVNSENWPVFKYHSVIC